MCLQKHGGNSAAGKGGHGAGDNLAGTAFRGGGGLGSASGGGGSAGGRGLGRVGDGEGGAVRVLGHGHDTDGVGARRDGGGDGGVVDGGKVSRAIQGADRSHVLDSSRGAVDKLDVDSLSSSTHAGTVAGPAQVLGLANFPGGGSGGVAIKKKKEIGRHRRRVSILVFFADRHGAHSSRKRKESLSGSPRHESTLSLSTYLIAIFWAVAVAARARATVAARNFMVVVVMGVCLGCSCGWMRG